MSKWELRRFFERLVQLRALYRLRGSDDDTVTISVPDVLAYAARLVDDPLALANAIGPADDDVQTHERAASDHSAN
jgi:hypothetical protein